MQNILWITPKWPLPAEDGARKATVDLLRSLSALGQRIHLVSITGFDEVVNTDQLRSEIKLESATEIRRSKSSTFLRLTSLLLKPWLPLTISPYATCGITQELDKIIKSKKWDYIVYDGLHPAAHSTKFGEYVRPQSDAKIIYRAHNREADIWYRKIDATKNFLFSFFLSFQAKLVKRFEDSVAKQAHSVATVSNEDLLSFQRSVPTVKAGVVPIGFPFNNPPHFPSEVNFLQIMFLGKLDWLPNKQGLIWFLKKVWPEVTKARSDLKLVIAGSGESSWLKEFINLPNLIFLGRIDSVEELYRNSFLSLVPIFYGSGTRVKVIEAAKFGRACLSTRIGVEGVGLTAGKSYFNAEEKQEWIETLIKLTPESCRILGEEAFAVTKADFESLTCARKFINLSLV